MSVSAQTYKKAQEIFQQGKIQQIDDKTFLVQGSKGDYYEVTKDDEKFVCYKGNNICLGWKYNHDCKHCQAVRIFLGL